MKYILIILFVFAGCRKNDYKPVHTVKFITDANISKQLIIDGTNKVNLIGEVESGQIINAKASSAVGDSLNAVLSIDGTIVGQHHGPGTFSLNYIFR